MTRSPCSILSAILAGSLAAQEQGACSRAGDGVRQDIEYLAGPETEGRGVGTPGGQKAIEYVARRMREIGLEAPSCASCDGYLQTFVAEDHRPRPVSKDSCLVFVHEGNEIKLEIGTDAIAFSRAGEGKAEAPVVFVGYGLVIPELSRDDYAGLDVKGKVVLMLYGRPKGGAADPRLQEHRAALSTANKLAAAERAGAAAIVVCRLEELTETTASREEPVAYTPPTPGVPSFVVRPAASQELFTRIGDSLAERQRALDNGKQAKLGPLGAVDARIALHFGQRPPLRKTANVIGIVPGREASLASEFVVVGAHHDHLGHGEYGSLGGKGAFGQVHPGADDNASGVAAMLEAARELRAAGGAARSVLFVAFGAGEAGRQGSRAFLESGPVPKDRIVAMLSIDSVGRANSRPLKIEAVGSGSGFADLFGRLARRAGFEATLRDDASRWPERSDHITFLHAKIPSVWLTTGVHEQYRRPSDIAALIDFGGVARVAALVRDVASELGGKRPRPEFVTKR